MPSKNFLAPVFWTRPRCAIYNENYRFGNSLINQGLNSVERKYHESMAKTEFKSLSRTPQDILAEASLPLSHSVSSSNLPPRPDTPSYNSLRRTMSVSRSNSSNADFVTDFETSPLRRSRSLRRRPESTHFTDLPSFSSLEVPSQTIYSDRCRELSSEIERLNSSLLDAETKLKQEAAHVKSKLNTEVQTLQFVADEQEQNLDDLRSLVRKQQKQIKELQSNFESMSRNYDLAVDELQNIKRKASAICNEVDTMRASIDRTS